MCSAKFRRPKPTPLRSFLGALAALLLSSACADENTRLLRAGDASYRSGNYVEARLSYRRATQSNSQLTEAYYRLGLTEQKLQNMRAAFLALVQASRLAPARDDIKIALADVCIAGLTYDPSRPAELRDTALRMADEILVKDPKSPAALRIKGSLALLGNSPADAVNYFKAARQQRPDDANLTVRLIESLVLSGSGREAEQLATQHIALHKGDGDVYDAIFAYYSQQNRTNEAERTLKLKISNNPGEPAYVTKLASFYWRLGRQDQALDLVTRMLARPARPAAAHLAAGDFYHSIGRLEEAKQQFEEGLHAGKGQEIPFQERIMKISLAQGNSDQAALLADQILKEDPQNSEALPIRAALRVKSGQPNALAGAIEDYKLLLRKNGRDQETHYAFDRALQLKGDLASAKAEIQ